MANENSISENSKQSNWKKVSIIILKIIFFPLYFLYLGANASKEVFQAGKPFKNGNTNMADPSLIKKFFFVWLFWGGLIGIVIDMILSSAMILNKEKNEEQTNVQIFNETFWKLFFPSLFLGMVLGILITMSKTFNMPMSSLLYPFFFMVGIILFFINIGCGLGFISMGVVIDLIKNTIEYYQQKKVTK